MHPGCSPTHPGCSPTCIQAADPTYLQVPEVCKISGHMLELFWGYLLGEPADFECRTDLWGHRGPPPHGGSEGPTAAQPHAQRRPFRKRFMKRSP